MPEVSQAEFITAHEKKVERLHSRIIKEFSTLNHGQMQGLINDINYNRQLIGFAKSGKMKHYFI